MPEVTVAKSSISLTPKNFKFRQIFRSNLVEIIIQL